MLGWRDAPQGAEARRRMVVSHGNNDSQERKWEKSGNSSLTPFWHRALGLSSSHLVSPLAFYVTQQPEVLTRFAGVSEIMSVTAAAEK